MGVGKGGVGKEVRKEIPLFFLYGLDGGRDL